MDNIYMKKLKDIRVEFDRLDTLEIDELNKNIRKYKFARQAADICSQLISLGHKEFKRERKVWVKIQKDL